MSREIPTKTRLLRLNQVLAPDGPIPVSKSTWWLGVKTGRFPEALKLGANITVWRSDDIDRLIESIRPVEFPDIKVDR